MVIYYTHEFANSWEMYFLDLILLPITVLAETRIDPSASVVNFKLAAAQASDIKYFVFHNGKEVSIDEIDRALETKFILHGWTTNASSPWFDPLRDAYFKRGPCNVIYVDYSIAGSLPYPIAAANANPVGKYIANYIISANLTLKKVHVIGHSLGAQVSGYIGKHIYKKTGFKIGRISALDTGGPLWNMLPAFLRLNQDDADFVDTIHTDDGHYGFTAPHGHVDFYPSGGKNQPGCPEITSKLVGADDDNCSHARSTEFFIEAVNSNSFIARKASSWDDYKAGKFIDDTPVSLGEDCPRTARGKYYLYVNDNPPYAKGNS